MAESVQTQSATLLRRWRDCAGELKSIWEAGKTSLKDATKLTKFKGRYLTLERFYVKFETLTEDLFSLNPAIQGIEGMPQFPDAKQQSILDAARIYYLESHEFYVTAQQTTPLPPQNITVLGEGASSASNLPKINIGKFSGKYEEWVPFKDSFTSIVDTHPGLSPTQKFHHLLGALVGPAKSAISHLTISDANYKIAWDSLVDTYENKRMIASVYLNKLLAFKPQTGRPTQETYCQFLTEVADSVSAMRLLGIPNEADFILFHLASRCLDHHTREQFEFKIPRKEFPTMHQLTDFVRERQAAQQLAEPFVPTQYSQPGSSKGPGRKPEYQGKSSSASKTSLLTANPQGENPEGASPPSGSKGPATPCFVCNDQHGLLSCVSFHHMTPQKRFNSLKSFAGCRVCLTLLHTTDKCVSTALCRLCKGKHNTLLCIKSPSVHSKPDNTGTSQSSGGANLLTHQPPSPDGTTLNTTQAEAIDSQVILGTALIQIQDARGQYQQVRMVLDSASQYSYITHRCLMRLGLKMERTPRRISCLGGTPFEGAKGVTTCDIRAPGEDSTHLSAEAVVVRSITSFLPTVAVPVRVRNKYLNFNLADPRFFQPAPVDFLAGADIFSLVLSGSIESVGEDLPKLLNTIFGFVVIGRYFDKPAPTAGTSLVALGQATDAVSFDLQQFWMVEDIPDSATSAHPQEDLAEQSFQTRHYRLPSGQFGVPLPFKSVVPDLSSSETPARKRFYNMETKFKRNPELKAQYTEFMREYEVLGHMTPTSAPSKYVIPHHGVFNKSKLRVVFDGSCETPSGSLNDHLTIGQPLQNDIRNILVSFRAPKIAFVADMVKMYRQIEVSPVDRAFQHIFWRSDPSQALQKYELNTVTYGLSCSPFLALRCIQALRLEHQAQFPMAAQALEKHLYVDDVVTGASSLPEALELQKQLIAVLAKGGFPLAKWASNSPAILEAVPPVDHSNTAIDLSPDESPSMKVLGLQWNPTSDTFSYQLERPDIIPTKRGILSTVARIFDPLGLLAPTTISLKILIQRLWLAGLNWDETVPDEISKAWHDLISKLEVLSTLKIDRWVVTDLPHSYQLIAFSDSSEAAYCAAVYVRIIMHGSIQVKLLTAKTKVAPTKRLTIPRLELCGALLLTRLMKSLQPFTESLEGTPVPPVYFTDSSIVLAWIRLPPHRLKVFVSNRVAEIQSLTPVKSWRHVAGYDNPSDIATRGILPEALVDHPLWWSGPSWLSQPEDLWPASKVDYSKTPPETIEKENKPPTCLLSCSALPLLIEWMTRFSSYRRLIRVTALILRAVYNRRNPSAKRMGAYLLVEIAQAFMTCARLVQNYHFFQGDLTNLPRVEEKYKSLSPFLDKRGILRVGGRLRHADLPDDQRHQILLPHGSHFSALLLNFYHQAHFHPGPTLLQALIQTRFWIPSLRRLVRQTTRKCLKCFKLRADAVIPRMGDLPAHRLKRGRCFDHVGVDFAGPFTMKESNRRKAATSKVYLSLFVCMTTKALHLEAVTSLSTEAFLAAFSRFMSRRGKPSNVYSDNGTNFIGASKELKALENWYREEQTQDQIRDFSTIHQLEWHFNPPYSPHFGGLWEAGVKSVKRHLYLVAGDTPLTYEEISTFFCQVEALLNSRPLCPLSDDPNEADYLSPGHFLIGQSFMANPEPTLLDTKINVLSRWQLLKRFSEDVWSRWRIEYVSTLQKRAKWHRDPSVGLQPGDLVLIKLKDTPPFHWPTAKIVNVHPGLDGQVRVVTVRTPTSTYKRTTANLVPLLPLLEHMEGNDGPSPI